MKLHVPTKRAHSRAQVRTHHETPRECARAWQDFHLAMALSLSESQAESPQEVAPVGGFR